MHEKQFCGTECDQDFFFVSLPVAKGHMTIKVNREQFNLFCCLRAPQVHLNKGIIISIVLFLD
jgi:hypothetical protein